MQIAQVQLVSRQASDTLSLVQTARVNRVGRNWSVDTLHVTDTAVGQRSRPILAGVADHLGFRESATVVVCKAAFDDLTLADSATYERTTVLLVSLAISDTASRNVVLGLRHTDALAITDTALATTRRRPSSTTCRRGTSWRSRNKAAWFRPRVAVTDYVWLQDRASFAGPRYVSASDALVQTQHVPDPVQGVDTVLIGLQDLATANLVSAQPRAAHDALSFGYQAIGVVIRGCDPGDGGRQPGLYFGGHPGSGARLRG